MTTHLLTTLIAALTLAACQPAPSTADAATADTPAAPHNLIIYYHGDNIDALRRAVSTYGAEILYHYPNLHGIAIRIPAQKKPGRCRNLFQPPTGNRWCPKMYVASNKSVVDIEKSDGKCLNVIEHLLGKTAGFTHRTAYPLA